MRIILRKKNNPNGWLISWAKRKAREVDELRRERDLPFLVRTYPFQDIRRVTVRSYRTYTKIDVRGSGLRIFTTAARLRTSPTSSILNDWIIREIEFSSNGDLINAVNATALGNRLKINKRRYESIEQLTTDKVKTWDKVADAGLPAPLSQLWYGDTGLRPYSYAVMQLPSEFTNIGVDALYVGRLDLVYYERSTRMVTFRLREDSLFSQITFAGATIPDSVVPVIDAAQLIFLTTSIDNFSNPTFISDTVFFDETLENVSSGTVLTTNWHTFSNIAAGTVPAADGAFDITTSSTQSILGDVHPGHTMTFKVRVTGSVLDGIASFVRIRDGSPPLVKNNVFSATPIRDLTTATLISVDMRSLIGSTIGEPAKDIGGNFDFGTNTFDERWISFGSASLLPDTSQAFSHASAGGELNGPGAPVLDIGPYKYPSDLFVRGDLTLTGPGCVVLTSTYEFLTAGRSSTSKVLDYQIGPYEGLFVGYTTEYTENGSYGSSTTCHNDPHATYFERTHTHDSYLFRFSNGIPFLFEKSANAGSGSLVQNTGLFGPDTGSGPLILDWTLVGTAFDASVPFRAGERKNLGFGNSVMEGPAASIIAGKGMHTLLQPQKLDEAGDLVATDVIVDPQSGMSTSSEGLFDASGNKIRDVPIGVSNPTRRVAGDSITNYHALYRIYGSSGFTGTFRNFLVVNDVTWEAQAIAGKGSGTTPRANSPVSLADLEEAQISASDSGLPRLLAGSLFFGRNGVDVNIIWFDRAQTGLFMADEVVENSGLYTAARAAWLTATEDGSSQATIDALAATAMNHLTVYYNNFASVDLVLAVIRNISSFTRNDVMIVVEPKT